ncbi:MAG: peptidoglycan D,D-transpeptidase FtsI family protein [Candidatus Dormibacteria bacterium]
MNHPPPGRGRVRGWFLGESHDLRIRGLWLLLAFVAMAVALGVRLVDVQVRQGPALARAASQQRQGSVALPASRGRILDTTGRILVSNRPQFSVFADPGLIPESQRLEVAAALAPVLSLGPQRIVELLSTPSTRFVYLTHGLSEDLKDRLARLELPGIGTLPTEQRVYESSPLPASSFAANLLGYVDHDGNGRYGVESFYDRQLRGIDGRETTIRDLAGNAIVLSREKRTDPHNGQDLKLGLDSRIQHWAEQSIARGVAETQSESGSVLIMDTKSGAIRAWADFPTYDANHVSAESVARFRDLSVAGLYEPGSTMKVVTFAGGLDRGAITPGLTINEGPTTVGGFTIQDFDNKAHGVVTMAQVLEQSLNNGAIRVMQLMGGAAFYQNMATFGIGSRTGVDLSGEINQPLPPINRIQDSEFATDSFGQGLTVTPVQLLAAINAVANGGVWVQPHAVESRTDPVSGAVTPFIPATRRVISPATAVTLSTMMTGVVDNKGGSGFLARIPAFAHKIAGKTSTASQPTNGHYAGDVDVSFAGFLPADNPRFTMLVLLRSPRENKVDREGAYLAAPVWKDLAQIAIDQWRILP